MNKRSNPKKSVLTIILWPFKSYVRILIVFGIIALYQYQSFRIDFLAQELHRLEVKKAQLLNENKTIKVKIDQLTHINRVEKIARERFGLYLGGSDFERMVIEAYDGKTDQEWQDQDNVHIAGVR